MAISARWTGRPRERDSVRDDELGNAVDGVVEERRDDDELSNAVDGTVDVT